LPASTPTPASTLKLANPSISELVSNRETPYPFPVLTPGKGLFFAHLIMQKVFNVLSVAGFVLSAGMVAGSVMLYTRIPSITKHYMGELQTELTKVMADMVPGKIDDVMPELPTSTGPAVPGSIKSPF